MSLFAFSLSAADVLHITFNDLLHNNSKRTNFMRHAYMHLFSSKQMIPERSVYLNPKLCKLIHIFIIHIYYEF